MTITTHETSSLYSKVRCLAWLTTFSLFLMLLVPTVVSAQGQACPLYLLQLQQERFEHLGTDPSIYGEMCATAVSGDTAVVGGLTMYNHQGADTILVFEKQNGTWNHTQTLSHFMANGNPAASGSGFGVSVAIDGDTILVGTQAGYAVVFSRPSSGMDFEQDEELFPPSASSQYTGFGVSIALLGDRAVVGALTNSTQNGGGGSVFSFVRDSNNGVWSDEAVITNTNGGVVSPGDLYGSSLALDTDRLLVGAPGRGTSGDVSIHTLVNGAWDDGEYLSDVANTPTGNANFGTSVSLDGSSALIDGKVYVVDGSGNWNLQKKLKAAICHGGLPLLDRGDIDGDRALVAGLNASGKHVVFEFTRDGTEWTRQSTLTNSQGGFTGEMEYVWGDVAVIGGIALDGDNAVLGDMGIMETVTSTGYSGVFIYDLNNPFYVPGLEDSPFKRGDANRDGTVDMADAINMLQEIFGQTERNCADASDANDDGTNNIADVIFTLSYLFSNGEAPPAPGTSEAGEDPTPDDLGCEE